MCDLKVEVSDEGVGIASEDKCKLFEAFSQIRPGDLQDGRGSGLGLAIAKQIVKLHDGVIGVNSEPNNGSTFYFAVPLKFAEQKSASIHPETPSSPPVRSTRTKISPASSTRLDDAGTRTGEVALRVEAPAAVVMRAPAQIQRQLRRALVVDDVLSNRKMLAMILKKRGFECTLAEDGEDAVAKYEMDSADLETDQFDLICMDAVMPKMDGLEAARRIRRTGFEGPILGCTGNALTDDIRAYVEAGANKVLTKPISIAHLDNFLENL